MDKIEPKYLHAVELIKTVILQSQYNAIRLANFRGLPTLILAQWL